MSTKNNILENQEFKYLFSGVSFMYHKLIHAITMEKVRGKKKKK